MFNPSILIVWILHRLVSLSMLSAGLLFAISKVTTSYFTLRMPGWLQFFGHEIVHFGILKCHLVQAKPGNGVISLQWTSGDLRAPHQPGHNLLSSQRIRRWSVYHLWGADSSGVWRCCLGCVTPEDVFHRLLTPMLSLNGPNLRLRVLGCYQ